MPTQCPVCSASNPATARFCVQCGRRLPERCSGCGTPLVPDARFCHACGAAAEPNPASPEPETQRPPKPARDPAMPWVAAMEGEKRLATILFADMSSSVEVTRDLHTEDALALVNDLLKAIADAVFGHGGRVDRFLGDGALAVFGIPHASESDPERAVRAALQIRDRAHELGLEVTIGINTGEVYAGGVGSDLYQENTVMGPVVNLAARLEEYAAPGEILVGESTYRLCSAVFHFEERSLAAKGFSGPVSVYAVEQALARPARRDLADGQVLIGRTEERALLCEAMEAAVAGRGQVVCLIGEPGVGKSRLIAETKRRSDGMLWLEGQCLEFGETVGYWPFVDLLRQWVEWHPQEDADGRRRRILTRLEELVEAGLLEAQETADLLSCVGSLLSVRIEGAAGIESSAPGPESGPAARRRMFQQLRRLLLAIAHSRPLALVLEDLHWADSLSVDLVAFLIEAVPDAPLLLLCSYRAERDRPCWGLAAVAERRCPAALRTLYLRELSPDESCRLATAVLHAGAGTGAGAGPERAGVLEGPLRELVLQACHGNPLFVEEMVRSLLEGGALHQTASGWQVRDAPDAFRPPESLQGVILSRIDRLPPALKQVLQHASVLGTRFQPRVLVQLGFSPEALHRSLAQLEEHGLVLHERSAPEEVYAFKHALTRETIYETLLRRKRLELHRRVGEALELLHADRLEEAYDDLARHYSQSDRDQKAVDYLVKAGQKARRLFANREAAAYFERALRSQARMPPGAAGREWMLEALEGLGDVLFRMGAHRGAERHFLQARTLTSKADPVRFARLSWKLADAAHWQGQMQAAVEIAEAGLAVPEGSRTAADTVKLLEVIVRSHWARDDLESARRRAVELEALLPEVPYFDTLYMAYYALAWLEILCDRPETAVHWLEEMERVCTEHGSEIGLARCFHGRGDLCRAIQDYAGGAEWFARSVEVCERTGDAHLLMEGYLEWAQMLIYLGRPDEEIEPHLRRGMALAEEMAGAGGVSSIQGLCNALGRACAERGESARALAFYQRAFDFGPHPTPDQSLRPLRDLYSRLGRPEEFTQFCARVGHALSAD